MDSVEKKLSGSQGMITLKCKDFQIIQLEFQKAEDCINVAMSVEALSNIGEDNKGFSKVFHQFFFGSIN